MRMERAAHRSEDHPVSTAVVEAVAAARDASPLELKPLNTVVDADALDGLFSETATGGSRHGIIEFEYQGCLVAVDSSGGVEVSELDRDRDGPARS